MTEEQLATLYRKHGPAVYRRCLALLGNADEAQDALQEVFLRALTHGQDFRGEASPTTWLYRITTNHCLNRLRGRKPLTVVQPEHLTSGPSAGQTEARQVLDALVRRLDEDSARIAVYHFLDNMPQEEIEEVMGISRRTIGKKLQKIREITRRLSGRSEDRR